MIIQLILLQTVGLFVGGAIAYIFAPRTFLCILTWYHMGWDWWVIFIFLLIIAVFEDVVSYCILAEKEG